MVVSNPAVFRGRNSDCCTIVVRKNVSMPKPIYERRVVEFRPRDVVMALSRCESIKGLVAEYRDTKSVGLSTTSESDFHCSVCLSQECSIRPAYSARFRYEPRPPWISQVPQCFRF